MRILDEAQLAELLLANAEGFGRPSDPSLAAGHEIPVAMATFEDVSIISDRVAISQQFDLKPNKGFTFTQMREAFIMTSQDAIEDGREVLPERLQCS